MSRKIFKAVWLVAFCIIIASLIFAIVISTDSISKVQRSQLKLETELASRGIELDGEKYLKSLDADDYRITWISKDGKVLYDSDSNADRMDNHLEREEVKAAIKDGYGESARTSDTLDVQQYYAAQRLDDGSVVRVAVVQMTIWSNLINFAPVIILIIVIALAVSFLLASKLAKNIVKPINDIDTDRPRDYIGKSEYAELEPLLEKMDKQQEQLKGDREQIENASLIRQEFTANVSHELKTPLHAISGYAELIENGMAKNADIKTFAGKIRSESVRMTSLVEDIIDLTRLDGGAGDSEFEECDLARITENAVDSLRSAAAERKIKVDIDAESAIMNGVPQQLYSIVYNLCDNAIKYNRDEGKVKVKVRNKKDGILLSVKDTGVGIPKESRSRIFERFYRVDKSRSQDVGGTGLGLSIVKHAVLIHNGTIMVNSSKDKGSEFTVVFPK